MDLKLSINNNLMIKLSFWRVCKKKLDYIHKGNSVINVLYGLGVCETENGIQKIVHKTYLILVWSVGPP